MTNSVLLPALLLAGVLSPFGGAAHRKAENGNRLYADGALDDALRAYTEAQVAAPEAPELHYDIGNVLYRKEDYAGAAEAFTRALLSAPPSLAADAAYNLGNALYRDEKYQDAVQAYRRSLERRPSDGDAKRNLELALRALQREKDKKQQQPKDGEDKKDQEQQQKDSQKGDEGKNGEDKKQQGAQDKDEKKEQDEQKQQPQPSDPKDGEEKKQQSQGEKMSEQEAAQLLDRVGDEEKRNIKKLALQQAAATEGKLPEKDW